MTPRNHGAACRFFLVMALGAPALGEPEPADSKSQPTPPASPPAIASTTTQAAEQPAPKPRTKLSDRILGEIVASIPVWRPPPPEPAEKAPPPPPDPSVVRMAPVVVKDYRLPRVEEKEWLTGKALDAELIKEYLPPFDRLFLNRFTLPIVGVPQEARARMMYREDKRVSDLKWMNDEIDQMKRVDPEAAKELKEIRNNTFIRPGN
jgi:hypothetical protein